MDRRAFVSGLGALTVQTSDVSHNGPDCTPKPVAYQVLTD